MEHASGQSYTDYVRQYLLTPAKMHSTGFWGETFESIASIPTETTGCSSPDTWSYSWVLVGNGRMVSTIGDMHKWVLALKGNRVLSATAKSSIGFDQQI